MPFGSREFFDVFRLYNESVWPAPIVLTIGAMIAAASVFAQHRFSRSIAAATLCVLFVWCGVAYHWFHFSGINPAAWFFGALFIAGGFAFLDGDLWFGAASGPRLIAAAAILAYALIGYPLTAYALGHRYPFVPTFGAPCPITIFAAGLLISARRVPIIPSIVPLIWALIGGSAAFILRVPEDLGLVASGAVLLFFVIRDRVQLPDHAAAG